MSRETGMQEVRRMIRQQEAQEEAHQRRRHRVARRLYGNDAPRDSEVEDAIGEVMPAFIGIAQESVRAGEPVGISLSGQIQRAQENLRETLGNVNFGFQPETFHGDWNLDDEAHEVPYRAEGVWGGGTIHVNGSEPIRVEEVEVEATIDNGLNYDELVDSIRNIQYHHYFGGAERPKPDKTIMKCKKKLDFNWED